LCVTTKAGRVACFGAEDSGLVAPPADLGAATSVAVGYNFTCASLAPEGRLEGTVVCWGDDSRRNQTDVPMGLAGVTQVAASAFWTFALKGGGAQG
jgi:hypothetical protein